MFGGEAYDCKKAVGGIVDCCGTPDGISLADYLSLILAVGKLDSALMGLDPGAAVRGAWETLRDPCRVHLERRDATASPRWPTT